ncbi:uncharacterized protein LOC123676035 [Harmonia axyridis]|uniref:uncharacterized protein LOC123676035 n=1 Tax=Harmonia axyridis TaxID=115357 RepID=UPI001E275620|nr:uncharacterized protein LOC123676035 [Harmonia axyridis]
MNRKLDISEKKLVIILPELYRCPICLNTMNGIIRQCLTGHNYCQKCSERIAKCPICRESMSSGRNRALENINPKILAECSNEISNCRYANSFPMIQFHENLCFFSNRKLDLKEVGKWIPDVLSAENPESAEPPFEYLTTQSAALVHKNFLTFSSKPKMFATKELLYHKKWIFRPYCRFDECEVKWCIVFYGPKTRSERGRFHLKLIDRKCNVLPLLVNEACLFTDKIPSPDQFKCGTRFNFLRHMFSQNLYYFLEISVDP